nr:hypothetical protein [Paraburkholderia sp. BL27I4N3]
MSARFSVPGNEHGQLQQIFSAEMRSSRGHCLECIGIRGARPGCRHALQVTRVVVEVDAVFSPRAAPFYKREFSSVQRMEGMSDPKQLFRIGQIACS